MLSIKMIPARLYTLSLSTNWQDVVEPKPNIYPTRPDTLSRRILDKFIGTEQQVGFINDVETNVKRLKTSGIDELINLILEAESALDNIDIKEFTTISDDPKFNDININTKDFLNLIVAAELTDITELNYSSGFDLIFDIGRNQDDIAQKQITVRQEELLKDPNFFQAAITGFLSLDENVQFELYEFVKLLKYIKENALEIGKEIKAN